MVRLRNGKCSSSKEGLRQAGRKGQENYEGKTEKTDGKKGGKVGRKIYVVEVN